MATQVQLRGGTTSEHSSFTGAAREVTVDTDKDVVVVHDGSTAGGIPLAKEASVLPLAGGALTGAVTTTSTFDGRNVSVDGGKLDAIEASADVTDTTNVTASGALMDSEVTNLAQVKAFDTTDYATAAQGTTADAALPKAGGTMTGTIADFTSTGIDDNATSTAITITSAERVGLGTTAPSNIFEVQTTGATTANIGISNTGTGEASLMFDASNGDFSGSDYGWIKQKNDLDMEIGTADQSSGDLIFNLNGSERARILSAVGGGISFNGDTAAANALDDYEEGTWTPVDINGVAYTSDVQATYTKIGRWVYINFDISSTGSTSGTRIVGLPFTALSSTVSGNWVVSNGYASDEDVCGHISASTNSITMFTGTLSYTMNGRFIGSGSYYA